LKESENGSSGFADRFGDSFAGATGDFPRAFPASVFRVNCDLIFGVGVFAKSGCSVRFTQSCIFRSTGGFTQLFSTKSFGKALCPGLELFVCFGRLAGATCFTMTGAPNKRSGCSDFCMGFVASFFIQWLSLTTLLRGVLLAFAGISILPFIGGVAM
jgi:hypothetical protein